MLYVYRYISLGFLLLILPIRLTAQPKGYIAIIPSFHSRQNTTGTRSPLELRNLKFIIYIYENAAAVYSETDFINQSDNFIEQELALPSKGHNENDIESVSRISNGILSIQLWVQGEKVNPQFIKDGDEEWYTIQLKLKPHESRKVKSLFWAETALTDISYFPGLDTVVIANGKRGFLIDLAHASVWNRSIQSIDITVILKDGIFPTWETYSAGLPTYNLEDSTLTWSMKNIEPTTNNNVLVKYESDKNSDLTKNTMAKLSAFIVKKVYGKLLYFISQMNK